MRKLTVIAVTLIAMLGTGVTVMGQSSDAWLGTWRLNLAKSVYNPGPAPQSQTVNYEPAEGGLKEIIDGLNAQGQPGHVETVGKFDGKDSSMRGAQIPTTRAYKRIDDHRFESVEQRQGHSDEKAHHLP